MIHWLFTHPELVVLGYFVVAALGLLLFYCMVNAGGEAPTFVEVEEIPSAWDTFPEKWVPPAAESHLGKEHVGERRRAA
jgi:ABC-type sugar transport system permease subunit